MNAFVRLVTTAAVAGTAGSLANTLGINAVKSAGLKPGTGGLGTIVFGRTLPPLEAEAFHLGMGIAMATAYVIAFRDRLPGPPWMRGLLFAQIPGALQLLWVLPATGKGIGGATISSQTPLLAWSLNALYGVVLGAAAGSE